MDFERIDFLTSLKINELEAKVALTSSSKTEYTAVERTEALESLGIAQYFNGDYFDALHNLEASISQKYIKLKSKKRLALIQSLVSQHNASVSTFAIISIHLSFSFNAPARCALLSIWRLAACGDYVFLFR